MGSCERLVDRLTGTGGQGRDRRLAQEDRVGERAALAGQDEEHLDDGGGAQPQVLDFGRDLNVEPHCTVDFESNTDEAARSGSGPAVAVEVGLVVMVIAVWSSPIPWSGWWG